jgi:hypothetical protein
MGGTARHDDPARARLAMAEYIQLDDLEFVFILSLGGF